jgi:translation initiation factor 2 alpha subunit (eIF-2alpha)
MTKESKEKLIKIIESKKEKPKELSQIFRISSKSSEGILIIKKIIKESCKDIKCNITYLAAGRYNIKIEGKDFKEIKNQMNPFLNQIEKLANKNKCEFSLEKN